MNTKPQQVAGARLRPRPVLAPAVLLGVLQATAIPAVASATLPAIHLNAVIYDKHVSSNGTVSSREKLSQGTKHVGEDYSRCVPSSKSTVHCTGSYTLTHGTIAFAGTISNASDTNRLTITGGTWSYKHAHGSVLTEYNQTGTHAKETITFQ
jgi:hypothetical protein